MVGERKMNLAKTPRARKVDGGRGNSRRHQRKRRERRKRTQVERGRRCTGSGIKKNKQEHKKYRTAGRQPEVLGWGKEDESRQDAKIAKGRRLKGEQPETSTQATRETQKNASGENGWKVCDRSSPTKSNRGPEINNGTPRRKVRYSRQKVTGCYILQKICVRDRFSVCK